MPRNAIRVYHKETGKTVTTVNYKAFPNTFKGIPNNCPTPVRNYSEDYFVSTTKDTQRGIIIKLRRKDYMCGPSGGDTFYPFLKTINITPDDPGLHLEEPIRLNPTNMSEAKVTILFPSSIRNYEGKGLDKSEAKHKTPTHVRDMDGETTPYDFP